MVSPADAQSLSETNIASNPSGTGLPNPLESDRGWGGGSYPWDIVDGQRSYDTWARGLAFTGGHTDGWNSPGYLSPCGSRQATIDFGDNRTFSKVSVWHHGTDHTPQAPFLEYWNGDRWLDIPFQRVYGREEAPGTGSGNSTSDEYTFAPVTGSKVRYRFDNCGTNILGTPNIHGWIYEVEVFLEQQCENIAITSHPRPQTVVIGGPVTFFASVTGTPPISYQWRFNGQDLSAATDPVLTLSNVQPAQVGAYSVVLINCAGSVTSDEASLFVISETNRLFNVGQIPNATVWHGQSLEFFVRSEDLGGQTSLTATPLTPTTGTFTFDSSTGRVRYSPSAEDKRSFIVRFVATLAGQTRTQDVEITPMPHLPPEETTFGLMPVHPLPDPESKDYIVRNEILSETEESLNTQLRKTRTVVLMGEDVVFQRGHPNGLFDSYHDSADIKSLTVYAERMIVRSALKLPQTEVTIYARQLVFQDGAETSSINTTPRSIPTRAASATGFNPGQNGSHGLKAGNVTLHAEQVVTPPGAVRFVLGGGNGQPAGLGQEGREGSSLPQVVYTDGCRTIYPPAGTTAFWFKQTHCTGCPRDERRGNWNAWPGDGGPGIPAGRPGNPGNGGDLLTSFSVPAGLVTAPAGIPGDLAPPSLGGRGGSPNPAYRYYYGCEDRFVLMGEHSSSRGPETASPGPAVSVGTIGGIRAVGHALSWLTPHALRQVLAHAKDAYLYGHFATAQAVFSEYDAVIARYSTNSEWQSLSPIWQAELTALQSEMQALLHRLANNLDYFGNPAGWVPMLSFEANLNLFRNEIEPAIRVLYLSYWVGNAANSLQQKVAGLASARGKLSEEVERFRTDYASAMEAMPALETEYVALSNNTERVQRYLEQLERALEDRARNNVEDRHKLPSWKKNLKVLSSVISVIPVYQPALGAIGQGLNVIADYDSDNPLATVQGLAGVAGEFSGGKMKQSMASWKGELDKLSLDNFTQRGVTVTNCVNRTNCTIQIVNGVPITNCVITTDCSERTYSPVEFVKNLEGYGKALAAGYKAYRELNQQAQAPANEVEAELQNLKASDPLFNQAVDDASKLMAQKELYARKLAEAIQAGARLSDGITHDLLAIDGLNRDASYGIAILDARAVSYLKEMERRAKERLLKYHYYLAKSYEYRLLRPYTGELRVDRLFDAFRDLVAAGKGQELSLQDYEALRAVYEEQLSSVAQEIVEIFNASPTERSFTIPVDVPREQLAELRPGHPIKVRLQRREWFFPSEENLRIANLAVAPGGLGAHFSVKCSPFKLTIAHSGISHLAYDGAEYLFRHYNSSTRSPLRWAVRYNCDGSVSPEQPSDATQSLLYSLLSRNGLQGNIQLFARPAVDAELEISVETATANIPIVTNLALQLTFDYTDRRTGIRTLDVVENTSGLAPYFIVGTTDLNGKQDGRGGFRRTYRDGAHVTLEAPAHVGKWWFTRWVASYDIGSQATNREIWLDMSNDVAVRADYRFIDEPDFDNDGLTDRWETLFFGSVAPRPEDDPDRDGITNYQEFLNGSIPVEIGSPPRFVRLTSENGRLFCTWLSLTGKVYQLQVRTDLNAEWQNYGQPFIAPGEQTSAYVLIDQPIRFLRVVSSE